MSQLIQGSFDGRYLRIAELGPSLQLNSLSVVDVDNGTVVIDVDDFTQVFEEEPI